MLAIIPSFLKARQIDQGTTESDMKELFDTCSNLTYIIECFATDTIGEAKFELRKIIVEMEASGMTNTEEALEKLKQAQDLLRAGDFDHAAVCAASASRQLQKKLRWPEDSQ